MIRRGRPDDANALAALGASSFRQTYAASVPSAALDAYVHGAFAPHVQRAALRDPACRVIVAEEREGLVGYAVARRALAPPCVEAADPLQLDRLYVAAPARGRGVGGALFASVLSDARDEARDAIWLGVWEHNTAAIEVYRRWGFVDVGNVSFDLAGEHQVDRVMCRTSAVTDRP